jgi:hypothetical protein
MSVVQSLKTKQTQLLFEFLFLKEVIDSSVENEKTIFEKSGSDVDFDELGL